jgi:LCP family protein required for cell wall assembly
MTDSDRTSLLARPLTRLLVAIPVCGMLVAGLLTAAWLVLGKPTPAKGAIWFQITETGTADFSGAPEQPFFFLALGNDARGDLDRGLGDAIHVIGVNPAARSATIINVPRDTTAPSGDKINAYHSLQGLGATAQQLNQMMGIQINYAITTNFPGFIDMVNSIGGIDVLLPVALDDPDAGAVFPAGPVHVDGHGALAISRDRKDHLGGDIDRTGFQAIVIMSALATLRAQNPGDVGTLKLATIVARHIKGSENVSLTDLYRLGRLALSIDPANIKSITIPVGTGAGSNLVVGDASGLFADFRDDAIVQTAG